MTEIPAELAAVIKSGDLRQLKVFCTLYRNKWDAEQNIYSVEQTPINLTNYLVKCANLTTKLDVAEVSEYTASNITLTFSNTKNEFAEDITTGFFPAGYQIYGSRVSLFVGTSFENKTPLFNGVIKSLPRYRPEDYQVEITVISVLEALKDIETKEVSVSYTGETLTLQAQEEGPPPVFRTLNTGVGGIDAVYANGTKLVEGVDYEVSQINDYLRPALVEIKNESFSSATITADYYVWKRNLTVSQIVSELLDAAKWPANQRDIQEVAWESLVREQLTPEIPFALGFFKENLTYKFNWLNTKNGTWQDTTARDENIYLKRSIFPRNWETEFTIRLDDLSGNTSGSNACYSIGNTPTSNRPYRIMNGLVLICNRRDGNTQYGKAIQLSIGVVNGGYIGTYNFNTGIYSPVNYIECPCRIRKLGSTWSIYLNEQLATSYEQDIEVDYENMYGSSNQRWSNLGQIWRVLNDDGSVRIDNITNPSIVSDPLELGDEGFWGPVSALIEGNGQYALEAFFSDNGTDFISGGNFDLGVDLASNKQYMRFVLSVSSIPSQGFNASSLFAFKYVSGVKIDFVNLSGQNILEALQDLALISGYEFGVSRTGIFFFRPRKTNTTPVYVLDEKELVKIDTVGKNLNELFTKITLDFDQVPLEFYANTGTRPTPVDKYGIIEKEISRPQLINYNNPELAQAIGPQLLAIYSSITNRISATAKINLVLDLGDVVNLQRELPLTVNPAFSDYTKYENLNTFYRACKIIGLTYDFQKRQVKYTLQDVSSKNTEPLRDFYQYQTTFPTPLDYKE